MLLTLEPKKWHKYYHVNPILFQQKRNGTSDPSNNAPNFGKLNLGKEVH